MHNTLSLLGITGTHTFLICAECLCSPHVICGMGGINSNTVVLEYLVIALSCTPVLEPSFKKTL